MSDKLREALHKAIGDCCVRSDTISGWLVSPTFAEEAIFKALASTEAAPSAPVPSESAIERAKALCDRLGACKSYAPFVAKQLEAYADQIRREALEEAAKEAEEWSGYDDSGTRSQILCEQVVKHIAAAIRALASPSEKAQKEPQ